MSDEPEGRSADDRLDVEREILTHLASRPHHAISWEDLLEWWLMERALEQEIRRVERALGALVAAGWLYRLNDSDGRVRYRIVPERLAGLRRRLESGSIREGG